MRIQHNIVAVNSYRNYTNNVSALNKNLEELSSGYRINRAGDDAAGLAISEKMRAQITGLEAAQKNAKDGITLVQTAEGALTEVHAMLNRIVELATQSANGTYDDAVDRFQLQKEINQLRGEIDRIANSTNFNGIKLLDGSLNGINSIITNITTSTVDRTYDTNGLVNLTVGGDLPGVDRGTLLHDEASGGAGARYNKEMSVDLSGSVWDTSTDDKTLTLKVGDVTITLTATSNQGKLSGSALVNAVLGRVQGINVTIEESGKSQRLITGGQGTGSVILTLDGQEVEMSASGGRLHFALTTTPGSTDDELNVASKTVTINGVKSAGVRAEYSVDLLKIFKKGVFDYESKVTFQGKEYVFKEGAGNYTDLAGFAAYVASAIENDLKSAAGAVGLDVTRVGNTGFTLLAREVGDISPTLPEIVVQRAEKVEAIGVAMTKQGVEHVNAQYKFSIVFDSGHDFGIFYNGKVYSLLATQRDDLPPTYQNYLVQRNLNYAGFTNMGALIAALKSDLDSSAEETWRSFTIREIVQGDGNTLIFDLEAKTDGRYSGGFGNGNNVSSAIEAQLKVLTTYVSATQFNDVMGTARQYGDDGVSGDSAEHSFRLSSDWIPGTAIEICGQKYDIGDGTADIMNLGRLTIEDKAYYVSYTAATRTFTLLANFTGKDTNHITYNYTRRVGTGETNKIERTTRGQAKERLTGPLTATGGSSGATGTTGKEQKASTRFQLTKDFVAEGARLRIGEIWYEFISDKSKQGTKKDGKTVYVDVSSGSLEEIARNLKAAAAASNKQIQDGGGKAVWSVDCNGAWILLDEADDHAGNYDTLEEYEQHCVFKLNTVKGVNDSLDYEGVLRHELIEITEETEKIVPGHGLILQIGDTADDFNRLEIFIGDCRTKAMVHTDEYGNKTSLADISIADQEGAQAAVAVAKSAINYISDVRGQLGAYQNRLDHTINNLSVMTENIQDAESTIRDTDIAEIMMEYTKNNILIQSAQAMLAQANQAPQSVLQLLG